jgi:hypothetical protein
VSDTDHLAWPSDPDGVDLPGGWDVARDWVAKLHSENPGPTLWTALDDRLRLTMAQVWVLMTLGHQDDDLAEDLADAESGNVHFQEMLGSLIVRWRTVYGDLKDGMSLLRHTELVGADMELVVLMSDAAAEVYAAGAPTPCHSFITKLESDRWYIAALARRLPVPGWPPSEETIPGLTIDGTPPS